VCPWNKFAVTAHELAFTPRGADAAAAQGVGTAG
jgi:hypothetical protein